MCYAQFCKEYDTYNKSKKKTNDEEESSNSENDYIEEEDAQFIYIIKSAYLGGICL